MADVLLVPIPPRLNLRMHHSMATRAQRDEVRRIVIRLAEVDVVNVQRLWQRCLGNAAPAALEAVPLPNQRLEPLGELGAIGSRARASLPPVVSRPDLRRLARLGRARHRGALIGGGPPSSILRPAVGDGLGDNFRRHSLALLRRGRAGLALVVRYMTGGEPAGRSWPVVAPNEPRRLPGFRNGRDQRSASALTRHPRQCGPLGVLPLFVPALAFGGCQHLTSISGGGSD